MAEPLLFILFKVVWQDLVENAVYDSTKQNWQVLQVVIDEIKNNKQVNQDLAVALEKCFYSSDKSIAEKCRDELIKNSTYTQYRGAKIYKPSENDRGIRKLEDKIKFLEKQLNQFDKKLFARKSSLELKYLEELLKKLSLSNFETAEELKKTARNQLLEELEKECDVGLYQNKVRDKANGLCKLMFSRFLIEVEPNEKLNSMFNARTHIIVNQIREKV
ncbi:MAG: hypothetical protein MJK14_25375 [Rivularia sp. ALOHA_DT_140]|nr:hypothetical protein [Rivularia sp. ALOHA_DT_140]